jgi:acetyl esterase/lipase
MLPEVAAYIAAAEKLARAARAEVRHVLDLPYGPERRHRLDLYLPADEAARDLPVLMFCHGGRWRRGLRQWNALMAPAVTAYPAILVSPSYGLSPEFRFPVPLEDVLTALAWTHRSIAEWGGAADRLFLGGHSAGGHLAALATLRRDRHPAHGLPDGVVKGCLPVSSTMNFDFDEVLPGSEEEEVRKILLADPADAPAASPLRHAAGNAVPFHLAHGENDYPRALSTNREMAAALAAGECLLEHSVFPGCGHFEAHLGLADPDHPWHASARDWMQGD